MRIETVCTGDELLTGLTADTNSTFFQRQLLERAGLTVRRSVVVGDVREDIIEALDAAAARCDLVLVSGGLGPTADDFTAECAATAAGVDLVESPEALAHIEARFKARGVALTPNNRRPALVPRGAEVVLNAEGSAPMFIQQRGSCRLVFVPGVPREYRHLVEHQVLPRILALVEAMGPRRVRVLRLLKTVDLPESHLDQRVRPLFAQHPRVTFGFRTHAPENHLKLLAEAPSQAEALAAVQAAEADSRAVLGAHVFAADDETMASVVLAALAAKQTTLSVAESCTGGLIGAQLTDVPGASTSFVGGAIVYTEALKERFAGVPAQILATHGAVSEETALAMAEGIRARAGTTFGLSVTGLAGPGGGDEKTPVGTVFIGLSGPTGATVVRHWFHGDRQRVRAFAAHSALDLLRRTVQEGSLT